MACDVDYHHRLNWLAELMLISPNTRMKRLQRESLKYYPLRSVEAIRHWMSWSVAFAAADIANKQILEQYHGNDAALRYPTGERTPVQPQVH